MPIPTVKIASDETESGYMIVRQADYDPKLHTLYAEKPAGPDLSRLTKDELKEMLESRGVDPESLEGTGKDGTVIKADLIAALEASD